MLLDGVAHALLQKSNREETAFLVLVVAIGLSFWVQYARTVRGSTLVEKNRDYVQAARLIGLSPARIVVRHILPNVMGPVLVIATINLAIAIITEATLSFLGVGLPATEPSLGTLIGIGQNYLFSGEWWIVAFPSLALDDSGSVGQSSGRLAARRAEPKAEMSAALLSVRDLRVEFATRRGPLIALDGLSFDIAPGEVLGVVGESGAGKTLTGLAIIGLLDPPGHIAGGEIRLDGERIDNLPPARMRALRGRRIGMIFQDPLTSLNPLLRVGDQLTETILAHMPLTRRQARERAIAWLGEVGIPSPAKRIDGYPHEFSGGMRQRVVIALALCAEPALIIADEPTTALDVSVQAQIIAVLKKVTRIHGAAVMLITHDMGVIAEMADRVAVMYAGRIVEIGAIGEVARRPLHPYAVGLMAAIPTLEPAPAASRRSRERCRGCRRFRGAALSTRVVRGSSIVARPSGRRSSRSAIGARPAGFTMPR